jgi:hypothetical protein
MLKTYINIKRTYLIDALILIKVYNRVEAKSLLIACYKALFKKSLNIYYYFISFKKNIKPSFRLFNNSYLVEVKI